MAWTSPRTWVVGEVVTAALMNTHVRDNFLALYPDIATSLPGSPYNDKFATLTDSLTAPTWQWTFRYLSAASSNKWKFQYGTPMRNTPLTVGSANITTYAFTSTQLTVPRTGSYDVTLMAPYVVGGGARPRLTVGVNATGDDTFSVSGGTPVSAGSVNVGFNYTWRRTFTAGDALSIGYRIEVGSIGWSAPVEMRLLPAEVT